MAKTVQSGPRRRKKKAKSKKASGKPAEAVTRADSGDQKPLPTMEDEFDCPQEVADSAARLRVTDRELKRAKKNREAAVDSLEASMISSGTHRIIAEIGGKKKLIRLTTTQKLEMVAAPTEKDKAKKPKKAAKKKPAKKKSSAGGSGKKVAKKKL